MLPDDFEVVLQHLRNTAAQFDEQDGLLARNVPNRCLSACIKNILGIVGDTLRALPEADRALLTRQLDVWPDGSDAQNISHV